MHEKLDDFTDEEKEVIRRTSMINTYRLLTSNYDFSIFPENLFWLLSDYNEMTVFDILLDYFESTEEYELCADVKKMKDHSLQVIAIRDTKKKLIEMNSKHNKD